MIDSVQGVSFAPLTSSKKQNKIEKKPKKQQFISQMEGKFYCTYVVGDAGKKILISKIPISEMEKENLSFQGSAFENIKNVIYHKNKIIEE